MADSGATTRMPQNCRTEVREITNCIAGAIERNTLTGKGRLQI